MPTQIATLEAYASHLLDDMIILREKYAMLAPMLSDSAVQQNFGSGRRGRGFATLRLSLIYACIQDIAKLASDADERAPSVRNIIGRLADAAVRNELREQYAVWDRSVPAEYADDPEVVAALQRINEREERSRRAAFDKHYAELLTKWKNLESSKAFAAFRTVRDKLAAHTEIKFVADKYQRVDMGSLGLTRTDLTSAIQELQDIVEMINLLVRNASFAWDMLDEQLSSTAGEFWAPPPDRGRAV